MRRFSLLSIILLCIAILIIDILAYYWLQSITQLFTSLFIQNSINFIFWFFSIGLISSITILKIQLDNINPKKRHRLISSLYGLTISSFVPKLIFVIIISILYFSNYLFSENESKIVIPLIGLFSGFLPFFAILYGIFRSLYHFKIHHHKIHIPTLPISFNGIKIIQISDIHLGSFNFQYHILDKAIESINKLEPDIILFTGDLVNNYAWELKGWDKTLGELTARIGKFSVLGNHDYGDYSQWKSPEDKELNFELINNFYQKIGFKLLKNESEIVKINNDKIAILGVENWGNPPFKQYGDLKRTLESVTEIPFKILLSHDPSHWGSEVIRKTDIAITFSGHTHGMQAGINLKNKKWSPIKYKYKHWAGLYKEHNQFLYVNRGLGWLGFPGRLGMRPEITFIELQK